MLDIQATILMPEQNIQKNEQKVRISDSLTSRMTSPFKCWTQKAQISDNYGFGESGVQLNITKKAFLKELHSAVQLQRDTKSGHYEYQFPNG